MKAKIFTVSYCRDTNEFDDSSIQEFLADKSLISFSYNYFEVDRLPHMVVAITYRDDMKESGGRVLQNQRKDWGRELDDVEKNIYDALRLWRNEKAEAEGKPAFILFTNRQFAEMATIRPTSLSDLEKISGVGTSRIHAYGADVLKIVKECGCSSAPVQASDDE